MQPEEKLTNKNGDGHNFVKGMTPTVGPYVRAKLSRSSHQEEEQDEDNEIARKATYQNGTKRLEYQ